MLTSALLRSLEIWCGWKGREAPFWNLLKNWKRTGCPKAADRQRWEGKKHLPLLAIFAQCRLMGHPYSLTSTPTKFLELKFMHLSIHSHIHSFTFNQLFIVHHYCVSSTSVKHCSRHGGANDNFKKQKKKKQTLVLLKGWKDKEGQPLWLTLMIPNGC